MELLNALISSGSAENIKEAKEIYREMQSRIYDGEDPEEVLMDYGLEPDYIFDLV